MQQCLVGSSQTAEIVVVVVVHASVGICCQGNFVFFLSCIDVSVVKSFFFNNLSSLFSLCWLVIVMLLVVIIGNIVFVSLTKEIRSVKSKQGEEGKKIFWF